MSAPSLQPRAAALVAAAGEPVPDVPFIVLKSDGVVLIYGSDAAAIDAADSLQSDLDVTVLLTPGTELAAAGARPYPVVYGRIGRLSGHLGAFELVVDAFSQAGNVPRNGAVSRCDLILDLSGGRALVSAPELRDGYVRADPRNREATLTAIGAARYLSGTFDKPRYIDFNESLCAHSRSKIVGCTRCLDLCPAGAITPAGDHVAIDANICAGCGQCAAACPTGAATYTLPPADALLRRLRTLLSTYRQAGGVDAVVLIHDSAHGAPLVAALAELGDELPENVLPFPVNEVTQVGFEAIVAAFAYGAGAVRFLLRGRARHDSTGLTASVELAQRVLDAMGFGMERVALLETDDPESLRQMLLAATRLRAAPGIATFLPLGGDKRPLVRKVLRELQRLAPQPVEVIAQPPGAAFGTVTIDAAGCTLCLSCVSACPTGALSENADRPMLRFTEDACIQCGLCKSTCPEKVITLTPQLDLRDSTSMPRTLKEEEPFCCIRCSKPFGVRSTIERVTAKLAGIHWMYTDSQRRLDLIKMCDDCRVAAITEQDFDPYAPPRAAVRTTDDYLREREAAKKTPGEN